MDAVGAVRYCELMKEVKYRTQVVHRILVGEATTGFMQTNVEVIYLQFRKILELIAFGSLVASLDAYAKARADYSRDWHASRVLKAVAAIHPDFYPRPVTQHKVQNQRHTAELRKYEGDYLSKDDFETLYDLCGGLLHSQNPYGKALKYEVHLDAAQGWGMKIRNLLNAHELRLINEDQFYLIQMGSADAGPTYNLFQRFSEDNQELEG